MNYQENFLREADRLSSFPIEKSQQEMLAAIYQDVLEEDPVINERKTTYINNLLETAWVITSNKQSLSALPAAIAAEGIPADIIMQDSEGNPFRFSISEGNLLLTDAGEERIPADRFIQELVKQGERIMDGDVEYTVQNITITKNPAFKLRLNICYTLRPKRKAQVITLKGEQK